MRLLQLLRLWPTVASRPLAGSVVGKLTARDELPLLAEPGSLASASDSPPPLLKSSRRRVRRPSRATSSILYLRAFDFLAKSRSHKPRNQRFAGSWL